VNARPDDATFHEVSAYGSAAWVAARLGRSLGWFRDHRDELATAGFPRPDPITGLWIKSDVDAWIDNRRSFTRSTQPAPSVQTKGVRDDFF
jgi:predicted DNA-binding transcriptional regulator AlpA